RTGEVRPVGKERIGRSEPEAHADLYLPTRRIGNRVGRDGQEVQGCWRKRVDILIGRRIIGGASHGTFVGKRDFVQQPPTVIQQVSYVEDVREDLGAQVTKQADGLGDFDIEGI